MVIQQKTLSLFGFKVFELFETKPPFIKSNKMSEEACFLHIIEGNGIALSEVDSLAFQSNDTILMRCGNYLTKVKKSRNKSNFSFFAVHFHPNVLKKIYKTDLPDFFNPSTESKQENSQKIATNFFIEKYISGMKYYFEYTESVNEELLILKLKEIILLLSQSDEQESIKTILHALFSPKVYELKQIIEAHLYDDLSLEEIALLSNRSLSTFKRDFKAVFNDSPANYIRKKRLEKAHELILKTSARIGDIAMKCGFNDFSHFSKLFHKHYQQNPSELRLNQNTNKLN